MAVVMVADNPQGTREIYDHVIKTAGIATPAGGILHISGPSPVAGWRVIEIWNSEEEAMQAREERIRPAAGTVGVVPPPLQFFDLHSCLVGDLSSIRTDR